MSGNRSKSAFFERGWVTLSADFRGKGASPTNHCWCHKTRVIAVSCGVKIFAVRLVSSQYTHLTDGQTDRRTELRQQYRALHYMQSHGKNLVFFQPWLNKRLYSRDVLPNGRPSRPNSIAYNCLHCVAALCFLIHNCNVGIYRWHNQHNIDDVRYIHAVAIAFYLIVGIDFTSLCCQWLSINTLTASAG